MNRPADHKGPGHQMYYATQPTRLTSNGPPDQHLWGKHPADTTDPAGQVTLGPNLRLTNVSGHVSEVDGRPSNGNSSDLAGQDEGPEEDVWVDPWVANKLRPQFGTFYAGYDPMTGVRTAAILGSFLMVVVVYVLYKAYCRRRNWTEADHKYVEQYKKKLQEKMSNRNKQTNLRVIDPVLKPNQNVMEATANWIHSQPLYTAIPDTLEHFYDNINLHNSNRELRRPSNVSNTADIHVHIGSEDSRNFCCDCTPQNMINLDSPSHCINCINKRFSCHSTEESNIHAMLNNRNADPDSTTMHLPLHPNFLVPKENGTSPLRVNPMPGSLGPTGLFRAHSWNEAIRARKNKIGDQTPMLHNTTAWTGTKCPPTRGGNMPPSNHCLNRTGNEPTAGDSYPSSKYASDNSVAGHSGSPCNSGFHNRNLVSSGLLMASTLPPYPGAARGDGTSALPSQNKTPSNTQSGSIPNIPALALTPISILTPLLPVPSSLDSFISSPVESDLPSSIALSGTSSIPRFTSSSSDIRFQNGASMPSDLNFGSGSVEDHSKRSEKRELLKSVAAVYKEAKLRSPAEKVLPISHSPSLNFKQGSEDIIQNVFKSEPNLVITGVSSGDVVIPMTDLAETNSQGKETDRQQPGKKKGDRKTSGSLSDGCSSQDTSSTHMTSDTVTKL